MTFRAGSHTVSTGPDSNAVLFKYNAATLDFDWAIPCGIGAAGGPDVRGLVYGSSGLYVAGDVHGTTAFGSHSVTSTDPCPITRSFCTDDPWLPDNCNCGDCGYSACGDCDCDYYSGCCTSPWSTDTTDPFVARFSESGVAQWAVTASGMGTDNMKDIDADATGDGVWVLTQMAYVAGTSTTVGSSSFASMSPHSAIPFHVDSSGTVRTPP